MTPEQFDKAFEYLRGNRWKHDLPDSRVSRTKSLYFHKLKHYSLQTVYKAFDAIMSDLDQMCFPSLQRIVLEIALKEPIKQAVPLPKKNNKNKKVIQRMFKETTRIMKSNIPDKKTKLLKLTKECKEQMA